MEKLSFRHKPDLDFWPLFGYPDPLCTVRRLQTRSRLHILYVELILLISRGYIIHALTLRVIVFSPRECSV